MSAISSTRRAMHAFDSEVERELGVDLRLIYGMGGPILAVTGLIVLLAFVTHPWVVAGILAVECVLVGVVLLGFTDLLSEEDDEQPPAE